MKAIVQLGVLASFAVGSIAFANPVLVSPVNGQRVPGQGPASGVLWDNGDTNGVNGVSNATAAAFGSRRTLLDDFEITDPLGWHIREIQWLHVHSAIPSGPPSTGIELRFWSDSSGDPGAPITGLVNVTNFTEVATGRSWFSRTEWQSNAEFDQVTLGPGRYWIEATIVNPEQNFWLVHDNPTGSAMWVDYADLGGLQPGRNVFGNDFDLSFMLKGEVVPTPGALALLAKVAFPAAFADFLASSFPK